MEIVTHSFFWMLPICLLVGIYVAWNIGANDVSNAMGTSVGSKTLSLKQAIIIAAVFEFIGAAFFGSEVSETLQEGLFDSSAWSHHTLVTTKGMLSSLLAAGIWMHLASLYKLPVSTTHSIVGAIVGFALIAGGIHSIHWDKVASITVSWILSPCLGAMSAFVIFLVLKKWIFSHSNPLARAKKYLPLMSFFAVFWVGLSWLLIDPAELQIEHVSILALIATLIATLIWAAERWILPPETEEEKNFTSLAASFVVLQRKKKRLLSQTDTNPQAWDTLKAIEQELADLSPLIQKAGLESEDKQQYRKLEKLFGILQVLTACLMAFAHGSNDVANAVGPLNACLSNLTKSGIAEAGSLLPYTLPLGGLFIVIGLATWGWRVMETIGSGITELTPSRGFAAEFGASSTIFLASKLGLPVSTTHTLVGAVIGVGLAGGFASINTKTLRDIAMSWCITVPAGAFLSILLFSFFSLIFPT